MVIEVDGNSLTVEDVVQVARFNEPCLLAKDAIDRVQKNRQVVESVIKTGSTVYGVNTGFGDLASVSIGSDDLNRLQINIIRSHSAGIGSPLPYEVVRGMMLLRANSLAKGYSGVRLVVIETLLDMLNRHVYNGNLYLIKYTNLMSLE